MSNQFNNNNYANNNQKKNSGNFQKRRGENTVNNEERNSCNPQRANNRNLAPNKREESSKKMNNQQSNKSRSYGLQLGDALFYHYLAPTNQKVVEALRCTTQAALNPYYSYLEKAIDAETKRGQYEVNWKQLNDKVVIQLEPINRKYHIKKIPPKFIINSSYENLKDEKNRLINDSKDTIISTFAKTDVQEVENGFMFISFTESLPSKTESLELNGDKVEFSCWSPVISQNSVFKNKNLELKIDRLIENDDGWDIIVSNIKLDRTISIDGNEYITSPYPTNSFQHLYDGNEPLDFEKSGNQYYLNKQPKEKVLKTENGDEYNWFQNDSQKDYCIQLIDDDNDDTAKPSSEYFFDDGVEEIYQESNPKNKIKIKHKNSEEKILILLRPYKGNIQLNKDEPIKIAVNTTILKRQKEGIKLLNNSPIEEQKNLIKLFENKEHSRWDTFELKPINSWYVLTNSEYDGTKEQREFVQKAISTPEFAILEGPPGSGKTTAILELILQLAKEGKRILLSASTHAAIDNVLERIDKYDRDKIIEPLRIGDEGRISDSVSHFQINNKIDNLVEKGMPGELAEKFVLDSANLVCGTTMGIQQHPQMKNKNNELPVAPIYDYLIIDESSKTTFQEFIVPALYAKKWILVGDIKQLSPYIEQLDIVHNFDSLIPTDLQYALKLIFFTLTQYGTKNPYIAEVNSQVVQYIDKYLSDWIVKADNPYKDVVLCSLTREHLELKSIVSIKIEENPILLFGSDLILVEKGYFNDVKSYLPKTHILLTETNINDSPEPFLFEQAYLCKHRKLPYYNKVYSKDKKNDQSSEKQNLFQPCTISTNFMDVFHEKSWAEEITWRMIRVYERRMLKKRDSFYEKSYELLKPTEKGNAVDRLYNMTLPSILESIQKGNGEKSKKNQTVITEGFNEKDLNNRHTILTCQHRMHPDISKFSRDEFYTTDKSLALIDSTTINREWDYKEYPTRAVWIDVKAKDEKQDRKNFEEAKRIIEEIKKFLAYAKNNKHPTEKEWNIAVITYYRPQETLLREKLRDFCSQPDKVSRFQKNGVNILLYTVDKFQGMEADLVFISMVRRKSIGFMDNINRLNVALTRAKYQRVIVGDFDFFKTQKNSKELKELAGTSEKIL